MGFGGPVQQLSRRRPGVTAVACAGQGHGAWGQEPQGSSPQVWTWSVISDGLLINSKHRNFLSLYRTRWNELGDVGTRSSQARVRCET